jgi:carbamoyltransferase
MRILGISPADVWLSSAALLEDGKVTAACAEERLDRQKMSKAFPVKAINFCLRQAKISIKDVDYVVMSWNPAVHIRSASMRYLSAIRWRGEYLYSVPSYLLSQFQSPGVKRIEECIYLDDGKRIPIIFVNHHDAHAANAFLLSPFKEASIMTIDGRGESDSCVFFKGEGNSIKRIKSINMPYSLGLFYSSFTEYLGFAPHSDEWKVMALASYGRRNNKYYKIIKKLINLKKDGTFGMDLSYFEYYFFDKQPTMYSEKLTALFGAPRAKDSAINQRHIQIACALQQVYEEVAAHLLNHLYRAARSKNLAFAGGCAMNSVFNGKIRKATPFKEVFISSCPDDSGTAIGAALYAYNCIFKQAKRAKQSHNYWGPEFSDSQIRDTLDRHKVRYTHCPQIHKEAARLLSEGKLVGWFQGRMEFGQRALGNRSILADPRDVRMKDLVNKAVKFRESFRPFAPSVLEGHADEYFDIPKDEDVPFMEKVYPVRPKKRKLVPAVVHVDGSGRLQIVEERVNPLFYNLIAEFKKITGIPLILNTSFNLNGEPIVCSPQDAVRTFFSCGLDYLAIGNYLLAKEG